MVITARPNRVRQHQGRPITKRHAAAMDLIRQPPIHLMSWFDSGFWSYHFERVFVAEVRAFERAAVGRVLPAFDDLEAEADAFAAVEYERLGAMPADENVDMGDLAEMAEEAGIDRYEELTGVRQAMLNLMTAALFHLVEQQLFLFFRRQVLRPEEEAGVNLNTWRIVHERFAAAGVDLKVLNGWPKFRELECVANVVKHGDGPSAQLLRALNPRVLVPELFRKDPRLNKPIGAVGTPLSGDGVHVTASELRIYADAAVAFWRDLAEAIRAADAKGKDTS